MMAMTLLQALVDLGMALNGLPQVIRIRETVEAPVSSVTSIAYGVQGGVIPLVAEIDWKNGIGSITDCP